MQKIKITHFLRQVQRMTERKPVAMMGVTGVQIAMMMMMTEIMMEVKAMRNLMMLRLLTQLNCKRVAI